MLRGQMQLIGSATYTNKYDQRFTQAAPDQDLMGDVGSPPRWRGRAGIQWGSRLETASVFANFVSGLTDIVAVPNRRVPSWTTFDLFWGLSLGDAFRRRAYTDGASLSMTVSNVFNKTPPLITSLSSAFGFDAVNANPYGRQFSVELRKTW
jgi:outer membrane receptor protein involved in Fe transport